MCPVSGELGSTVVVRMSFQNAISPVDLLQEYDAGKFVGKGLWPEAQAAVSLCPNCL